MPAVLPARLRVTTATARASGQGPGFRTTDQPMRVSGLLQVLRRAAPVLAVLALTLRVLVPTGFMVATVPDGGLQMTLCTGMGAITTAPDEGGKAPDTGKGASDSPCAFAGLTVFTPAESVLLPVPAPWPSPAVSGEVRTEDLRPGLGLPAPPPPKTGPPSLA